MTTTKFSVSPSGEKFPLPKDGGLGVWAYKHIHGFHPEKTILYE